MREADPCTLPTWVSVWDDPTENFGRAGGMLRPPHYERDRAVAELEIHLLVSDLEFHANWHGGSYEFTRLAVLNDDGRRHR